MEEDAIDFILEQVVHADIDLELFYQQLSDNFEHGLKLIRDKTGRNRFFITREALLDPEKHISALIKNELSMT